MLVHTLICALAAAGALVADELPRGQVVERVTARDNDRQSYALYLPSNYAPERSWPILYCLDPGARGRMPVERFAQAAEKAGFLVAGSNNSRNGPIGPVQEAIREMLADTHARFSIDDSRLYAAGFSGGARVALAWGLNGHLAGVIACGAGFGAPGLPKQVPFRLFAAAGVYDFNFDELYGMSTELARRGVPHRFAEFDGGHEWLPAALAAEALDFFTGHLPPQAAQPSKEQEKQAAQFERRIEEIASAGDLEKRSLLKSLQKDAARPSDSAERRVARRVLGGLAIQSMEQSRELMAERRYAEAARALETAVLVRPENAAAWYSLGIAQAAAGNTRRAWEALEQAVAAGFRDRQRIEDEPLLARLRGDRRWQGLLENMR